MEKTVKDIINESVEIVDAIKQSARKSIVETFANLTKEDIKNTLKEAVSTGNDQPSGYDEDGRQKKVSGVGGSLEDKGDGPAIKEGDEPPNAEIKLELDEMDEADMANMPATPPAAPVKPQPTVKKDEPEDDLDLDLNSIIPDDEKDEKDEKDAKKEEKEPEEKEDENKNLKKEVTKLKTENRNLVNTLNTLKESLKEVSLINKKLACISNIFENFPTLKIKNKRYVVEQFDKAKSADQVKFVYDTIKSTLKENIGKTTDSATKIAKQITESANRNFDSTIKNSAGMLNEDVKRFQTLAGIE